MRSPMPTFFPIARSTQPSWRGLVCIALCLLLVSCGFHLKGVSPLPFTKLYTNIEDNSAFGADLRRAITASSPGTRFVAEPGQAEARLTRVSSSQLLRELTIDAQGRVEEYELTLEFIFQLTDAKGHVILPPTTLRAVRELPYDDSIVQAKQGEIATVFQQMQKSLIDRIVRLLSSPDVHQSFENAENLPVDETSEAGAGSAPPKAPTPWGAPRIGSGAGSY